MDDLDATHTGASLRPPQRRIEPGASRLLREGVAVAEGALRHQLRIGARDVLLSLPGQACDDDQQFRRPDWLRQALLEAGGERAQPVSRSRVGRQRDRRRLRRAAPVSRPLPKQYRSRR